MKKIAAPIRMELAQYRELETFAQFGSELDPKTKQKLEQGVRMKEILKQPRYQPVPVEEQIVILYAVMNQYLLKIPTEKIQAFEETFLEVLKEKHPEILESIRKNGTLEKVTEEKLIQVLKEQRKEAVWQQ